MQTGCAGGGLGAATESGDSFNSFALFLLGLFFCADCPEQRESALARATITNSVCIPLQQPTVTAGLTAVKLKAQPAASSSVTHLRAALCVTDSHVLDVQASLS